MTFTFTGVIALRTSLFFLITVNWYSNVRFLWYLVNAACVPFRDHPARTRQPSHAHRGATDGLSDQCGGLLTPGASGWTLPHWPVFVKRRLGVASGEICMSFSARRPPRCFEVFTRNCVKSNQGERRLVLHLHDAHCMHAELKGLLL